MQSAHATLLKRQWVLTTVKIKSKLLFILWPHVISHLLTFQFPLSQWSFLLWTHQVCSHLWLCSYFLSLKILSWLLVLLVATHSADSSLITLFKTAPTPQLFSYLVLFVAYTTNSIHLSVSAFLPHLTPHPCYHRMCGQEAGILFTLFSAVSLVCSTQEVFSTEEWRKIYSFSLMLSCQIICHHNSGMSPKLYSCNFIL